MTNQEIREKIFDAFSSNIKLVEKSYNRKIEIETENGPEYIDYPIYICPMCMNIFPREYLNQSYNNPLTLEDLPPKSLGGNPKILTCKMCNNSAGFKLDSQIVDFLKTESFILRVPGSQMKSSIIVNKGTKFKIETEITEDKGFNFILKTKNNELLTNTLEQLVDNWDGSKIDFSFQGPNRKQVELALIRIGLLLAFYYLGNRILFEDNYHKIRKHFLDSETYKLPHRGVFIFPESVYVQKGLNILTKPTSLRSFFIVYEIKIKTISKKIGFAFPGPGENGWNCYSNYVNLDKRTTLSFKDVTSNEYIEDSELVNAYDYLFGNI